MVDDEPGEHVDDPRSPKQPPWNWVAGFALGIGVGVALGAVFTGFFGPMSIGIGIAIGAGLAPIFAMAMARRPDTDQDPPEPD
ncbi:hypothetical protein GCM10010413_09490 [Promicromonospora sukumoe]|uniref:Uncharacterized protein n=1 Tax=Promicromonospora sukumoe TaxID=88382 RepID=A0A7W3J5M4_9MICO|nr:hypothetical protein [Promicromonospora sukumoe]MBA8806619.1 hypothetical protein [Promicromonospora sukumoe]